MFENNFRNKNNANPLLIQINKLDPNKLANIDYYNEDSSRQVSNNYRSDQKNLHRLKNGNQNKTLGYNMGDDEYKIYNTYDNRATHTKKNENVFSNYDCNKSNQICNNSPQIIKRSHSNKSNYLGKVSEKFNTMRKMSNQLSMSKTVVLSRTIGRSLEYILKRDAFSNIVYHFKMKKAFSLLIEFFVKSFRTNKIATMDNLVDK